MAYNLTNLPGNFLTDASAIEAWDFRTPNSSGNYPGLIVPSRVLAVTGASTVPIQRVAGHRGVGIYQPAGCTQHLQIANDDSINAISDSENWLAVSIWWKPDTDSTNTGFGVSNGSGSQWSIEDLSYVIAYLKDSTGAVQASIEPGVQTLAGTWYHAVFQFYYDGSGFGCDMKCRINGTDYNTVGGTPTLLTPNFTSTIPLCIGALGGVAQEGVTWDSIILWKSSLTSLNSASMDAIYNNGFGFDFVGGQRRRMMRRARALGRI